MKRRTSLEVTYHRLMAVAINESDKCSEYEKDAFATVLQVMHEISEGIR